GCDVALLGLVLVTRLYVLGPLVMPLAFLYAACFAGLCPRYDMVCKGTAIMLVCRPMFAGWVPGCYWLAAKASFACYGALFGSGLVEDLSPHDWATD
ncbi:hypothetical protein H0E87_018396, partial [Populus deltoides]